MRGPHRRWFRQLAAVVAALALTAAAARAWAGTGILLADLRENLAQAPAVQQDMVEGPQQQRLVAGQLGDGDAQQRRRCQIGERGALVGQRDLAAQRAQHVGHGPLGDRAALERYRAMLAAIRDKVAALKSSGKTLADVQAAKPSAAFDADWGKGFMNAEAFVGLVYATL